MSNFNRTGMVVRILALFLALLFAMPLVPGLYISNHQPSIMNMIDEPPVLQNSGPRSPGVKVGDTNQQDATSINPARHIVRDNNNNIFAVFANMGQIWFSKSTDNGATFSTPKNISNDTLPTYSSLQPAIAYNGSALFVVWAYNTGNNGLEEYISFRKSNDNGTTWIPPLNQVPTKLAHATSATSRRMQPAIAVNDTAVYVICTNFNSNGLYFYKSLNSGNTWGWGGANDELFLNQVGGGTAGEASIAVSNESIYLSFSYNNGDIGYMYSNRGRNFLFNSAEFTGPTNIYQANTQSRYSNIIASGNNVYIAWEERLNGGAEIYFRNTTNQGGVWTPAIGQVPSVVSSSTRDAQTPSVTYKGPTSVFCTWRETGDHQTGDIVFAEWNGLTWTEPISVTYDNKTNIWPSSAPTIVNNRLDIVWTNGTNPYQVLYDGMYVGGSAPILNWTGENGYTLDGVNPDTGTTGHTYTWRVQYTDPDNEAPKAGYPKVYIDRNIDGDYLDVNEQITMTPSDVNDNTYSDGKLYTYSSRLPIIGTYTYRFYAQDTNGRPSYGEATKNTNGPTITSINEPPILTWLGDTNYINDGLDPETGFTDTNFTYKIIYVDLLNESPANGFPKLYIDMDNNGNFNDAGDQKVVMNAVDVNDRRYDLGKIYYYTTTLPMGTFKYMFYAEDFVGLSAETENRTGPVVGGKGSTPVLAPTGEAGFTTDGVNPDFGADTTEFTYRIKFTDADGDFPANTYPKISIDLNRDGNYSAGEIFSMTESDVSDLSTVDSKIYSYSKTLGILGMYSYRFQAMDTNLSVATSLDFVGPNVNLTNRKPELRWLGTPGFDNDGLDPETGNANVTVFKYNVVYRDADNNAPLAGFPMLWIDANLDGKETPSEWHSMMATNPANTDFKNDSRYEFNTTLPLVGTYKYRFMAKDSMGALSTGTPVLEKSGPVVILPPNQNPKLELIGVGEYNGTGVFPAVGDLDTQFVYKVKYIDVDGDFPGLEWPRVYIDYEGDGAYSGPHDKVGIMLEEDALDTNVMDGKVYTYSTLLPLEGMDYAYKFKALDPLGNAADFTGSIYDTIFEGPNVVVNKDPFLQFVPSAGYTTDGVDPDQAVENSTFTFRVIYRDNEGDKPLDGKVYLRIDLNKNKAIDATDPKLAMTETNPAAQDYVIGKEYMLTYQFVEDGTYGYRFEAKDAVNNTPIGQAAAEFILGPIVTETMPNRLPTLSFTGEMNYKNDGVNPLTALKVDNQRFTFRVRYTDLDNDAPATGYPRLLIDGQTLTMTAVDTTDNNYMDGKIYSVDVTLEKAKQYSYTFEAKNTIDQSATLGPMDGPIVTAEAKQVKGQMLPDMLWLIILIVIAIVMAIIGYLAGARRRREPEPQYRHAPRSRSQPPYSGHGGRGEGLREAPMVPLSSAEVKEGEADADITPDAKDEPELEEPKTDEKVWDPGRTKDAPAPVKEPEGADTKGELKDSKASSEAPASGSEDAKAPEDKPGPPPVATETKPELKTKAGAAEAPADDKVAQDDGANKVEEKKDENVDEEIDSILAKLEK